MRGRNNNNNNNNNGGNNNNRKGPNPLTRNYESNGPDVKIRGSAQQIAEKYATLARDAQSSGDRVMAENYLQHAEHYNRIIAAAQAQMPIQQIQRDNRDDMDDDLDDERDDFDQTNGDQQQPVQQQMNNGSGPQPIIEGTPAEVALNQDPVGENPRRANGNHPNGGDAEDGQRRRRSRRGRGRGDFSGEGADGNGGEPAGANSDETAMESADGGQPEASFEQVRRPAPEPEMDSPSVVQSDEPAPATQD